MLPRWSRAITQLRKVGSQQNLEFRKGLYVSQCRNSSKVAAAVAPATEESIEKSLSGKLEVNLNKMFWFKPCSLALAPDSPLRVEEPKYEGIRRIILKMMLFYSKQSKSIRGANVIYRRIVSQVDKPAIYNVQRCNQKLIIELGDCNGVWKETTEQLETIVLNYFSSIYTSSKLTNFEAILREVV